jgi:hypothetical protein
VTSDARAQALGAAIRVAVKVGIKAGNAVEARACERLRTQALVALHCAAHARDFMQCLKSSTRALAQLPEHF